MMKIEEGLDKIDDMMAMGDKEAMADLGFQPATTDMDFELSYEFLPSTWDMLLFNGLGVITIPDSIIGSLAALVTLVVQLTFIIIVGRSMIEDPLSEDNIVQLKQWRLFIGHQ